MVLCLLSGVMPGAPTAESPLPAGSENGSGRRHWGLWITAGIGGTLVALYAVVTPFVAPALRRVCLPFVPATSAQIENVLKMLQGRRGSVVDIGSGDGRIVSRRHLPSLFLLKCVANTPAAICFLLFYEYFVPGICCF